MDELAESAEICSTPMKVLPRSDQISILLLELHTTSRQIFDLIDKLKYVLATIRKFVLCILPIFHCFYWSAVVDVQNLLEKMKFYWIRISKTGDTVLSGPVAELQFSTLKFTKYKQSNRSIKKDKSRGCNLSMKWRPHCP